MGAVENVFLTLVLLSGALLALAVGRDLLRQQRERRNLDRLVARGPRREEPEEPEVPPGSIQRHLRAAGLWRVSPLTYLAASATLGVGSALAVRRMLPDLPAAAVVAAAAVVFFLWQLIKASGKRRARRFEERMVDAVALMIGGLKAGQNLTQAFASASEAAVGAVKREFSEVAHRLDLGMDVRRALRRIDQGYDSQGTRLFTRTVIAKWQAGGDIAPVLDNVNRVIRERLRIRWQVRSQLSGSRMATVLIAILPYSLIPLFVWQRPDWIDRLVNHPVGVRLLVAAILIQIFGVLWMRRMMRIEL